MKKYLSIVSNPTRFGNGHYARQKVLKNKLEQKGYKYEISINQKKFDTSIIRKNTTLVLDISNQDDEPTLRFLSNFEKSIAFDWSGSFIPDVNIVIVEHPGKHYSYKRAKFSGLEYFIVNDQVIFHKDKSSKLNDRYVLISLGYCNNSSRYLYAIEQVRAYTKIPIIIASGVSIELPNRENVSIFINPKNFFELISNAELIVSNAGTTLMESLFCGKTVIPIPQTIEEERFLNEVFKFTEVVETFPNSIKLPVKAATKNLLDFNGLNRVIEILTGNL